MRTVKSSLILAGIPAFLLLLNGCAAMPHAPDEKYILVADNTKIPYWQLASQGIARAAAEMKVHQDVQGPTVTIRRASTTLLSARSP